jgi:serine phosphatase RsbU (regulator of sigma subunit)
MYRGTFPSLLWAGAHNPLWYIENGELKEIKADKQPIGKTDNPKPFTTHSLSFLSPGSSIFLFTDGYADQFGGPKGKKFKYSTLSNLLLEIHTENPQNQFIRLTEEFELWKGNLEQVDDVCIIGIRL